MTPSQRAPDERRYIAIDLKSFYASVECNERGLDPLSTNLVVADLSRTEKTICLAVSPSLKSFGVPGRPRLFEVVQKIKNVNAERARALGRPLKGKSVSLPALQADPALAVDYLVARPRMAHYIAYSTLIYEVYLRFISPQDIIVYSIDEVFLDATNYLSTYGMSAHELAMTIIREVLATTGITATAGIGTNLYLCKIAMDIVAKKMPPDKDGVRIAELDERSYREKLWSHTPLTDFWRVGGGTASRLAPYGLTTMGDIARASVSPGGERLLFRLLGVNAELLIDHAWGWEPTTVADVKVYRPAGKSLSSGQVLPRPYAFEEARQVAREMTDALSYDLVAKKLRTRDVVLTVNYDRENLREGYCGSVDDDRYGRKIPAHGHGSKRLPRATCSGKLLDEVICALFDRVVDRRFTIRTINICLAQTIPENLALREERAETEQLSLLCDPHSSERARETEADERRRQEAILTLREKFGKNIVLRGLTYDPGSTARARNDQIGGHKA